jgi:hypothetical protein
MCFCDIHTLCIHSPARPEQKSKWAFKADPSKRQRVPEFPRSMANYPIKVSQFNRTHANEPFDHLKAKDLDKARKRGNLQKTGV